MAQVVVHHQRGDGVIIEARRPPDQTATGTDITASFDPPDLEVEGCHLGGVSAEGR